jgi:hypothetical protein
MLDHVDPPAKSFEERLCICLHEYGDHVIEPGRRLGEAALILRCDERERGRRCDCRDFRCWQHPDGECSTEPEQEGE